MNFLFLHVSTFNFLNKILEFFQRLLMLMSLMILFFEICETYDVFDSIFSLEIIYIRENESEKNKEGE
jgi:hypothetical protein